MGALKLTKSEQDVMAVVRGEKLYHELFTKDKKRPMLRFTAASEKLIQKGLIEKGVDNILYEV